MNLGLRILYTIFLVLNFMFLGCVNLFSLDLEEVKKKSENWLKQLNGTVKKEIGEEWKKKANELKSYSESEKFLEKVKIYEKEVNEILGKTFRLNIDEVMRMYEDWGEEKKKRVLKGESYVLGNDEKIYVFVSSSMGDIVRKYVRDSILVVGDVKFILRGAIGGLSYLQPTAEWVLTNLLINDKCRIFEEYCDIYEREFLIDPLLFRRFNVKKVPVVVYVKGDLEKPRVVVISPGAISFERHLQRIFKFLNKQ